MKRRGKNLGDFDDLRELGVDNGGVILLHFHWPVHIHRVFVVHCSFLEKVEKYWKSKYSSSGFPIGSYPLRSPPTPEEIMEERQREREDFSVLRVRFLRVLKVEEGEKEKEEKENGTKRTSSSSSSSSSSSHFFTFG